MTKYDTTGPVQVNERISFAIFSALLITTAVGLWLGLELQELSTRTLAPHQLELIRTGGNKEPPNRPPPTPATHPDAPPATTSRPATLPGGQ